MVEIEESKEREPQSFGEELKPYEERINKALPPIKCFEHKQDCLFVLTDTLDPICPLCIVEKQPDSKLLLMIKEFFNEKRQKLQKLLLSFLRVKNSLVSH